MAARFWVNRATLLTMGSLTLGNFSNVNVALGAPGNTLALFDVTGNLTLDGTLNVTDSGGFGAAITGFSIMAAR